MTKDDHLSRIKGSAQLVRSDTMHAPYIEKLRTALLAVERDFPDEDVRHYTGLIIPNLDRAATFLDHPKRKEEIAFALEQVSRLQDAIDGAVKKRFEKWVAASNDERTPPTLSRPLARPVSAHA